MNDVLTPIPKKKFEFTYKRQKLLWALIFLLPWFLGLMILFVIPFFESLMYSFYKLTPQVGEIQREFIGIDNYIFALESHVTARSSFKIELINTLTDVIFNLPVLLIFSLFIAVMLNMRFRGRALVRAIFFVPVILNSVAITAALSGGAAISDIINEQGIGKIFDLAFYLMQTGMPDFLVQFVVGLIGRIYDILALSGVPVLLFLASIQSIPNHLYEAAKIEGATGYEQFWLITLPNVSGHILTVTIYALVDTFLTSPVSQIISTELNKPTNWGLSSAMAWIYVLAILAVLLVIFVIAKILKLGESHYES